MKAKEIFNSLGYVQGIEEGADGHHFLYYVKNFYDYEKDNEKIKVTLHINFNIENASVAAYSRHTNSKGDFENKPGFLEADDINAIQIQIIELLKLNREPIDISKID